MIKYICDICGKEFDKDSKIEVYIPHCNTDHSICVTLTNNSAELVNGGYIIEDNKDVCNSCILKQLIKEHMADHDMLKVRKCISHTGCVHYIQTKAGRNSFITMCGCSNVFSSSSHSWPETNKQVTCQKCINIIEKHKNRR